MDAAGHEHRESKSPERLATRLPARPAANTLTPGVHVLPYGRRHALLHLPPAAFSRQQVPLAVMLHGSGGEPHQGLSLLQPWSEDAGVAVLAPASNDYTWDALLDQFGPDVKAIDQALQWVFDRVPVDAARVSIGGFSDGASYGLSLALANGDLFGRALALSPGYVAPTSRTASPGVFISHGVADTVLPIATCSRTIVRALRGAGYDVTYIEFEGGHIVPQDIAQRAVAFLLS